MIPYKNSHGNSGVSEYSIGIDFIKVKFKYSDKVYVYDHTAPGQGHVEEMKCLAEHGQGLATYISQNVKKNYSDIE